MADLLKPLAPSGFYVEFDGLTELVFKSVNVPDYKPKVAGGQDAIGSTKNGKSVRQVNQAGFETLVTFDVVCILSPTSSSASVQMYKWFKDCLPPSEGGNGKWASSKKTGKITLYNVDDEEVARWEFVEAWPSKYKLADVEVGGDKYVEETWTIVCEKSERVL